MNSRNIGNRCLINMTGEKENGQCTSPAWHGEVAESEFRKWLRSLSAGEVWRDQGIVVHPILGRHYELREHDVIIYDRHEANVLWKK